MTRNMKADALDAKFEEFLRELSTDDDSVRDPVPKSKDKGEPNLWWAKDKPVATVEVDNRMEAKPVRSWLKSATTQKLDHSSNVLAESSIDYKTKEDINVVETRRLSASRGSGDTSDDINMRLGLDLDSVPASLATEPEEEAAADYTEEFEPTEKTDDAETSSETYSTKSTRHGSDHDDEATDQSDSGSTTARDELQPFSATVLLNPALQNDVKDLVKPSVTSEFGLQTFVIQSGGDAVRGIQEILQEVEAVERSIKTNDSESETSVLLKSKSEPTASAPTIVKSSNSSISTKTGIQRPFSEGGRQSSRSRLPTKLDGDELACALEKNHQMADRIAAQDRLLAGYQKENEHLYEKGKRLRTELKNTSKSESDNMSKAMSTYGQRIDALLAENLDLKLALAEKQPVRDVNEAIDEINETSRLKRRILKLESAIKAQNLESKSIHDDVDFKTNRITSLEQQVKKLEELLRARHPDSISALVLASDIAGQKEDNRLPNRYSPRAVELLEQRVRDLEMQLVKKSEEATRSLQAVQSRHALLVARYNDRIASLEQTIGTDGGRPTARSASSTHRPMNSVAALEKELDGVRDRYRKEVAKLKSDVAMWQAKARPKADDDRAVLLARIRLLVQETRSQQRLIRDLREDSDGVTSIRRPTVPALDLASCVHGDDGAGDIARENLRVATAQTDVANLSIIRMRDEFQRQQSILQKSKDENDRLVGRVFQLSRELETSEVLVEKLKSERHRAQKESEHVPLLRARIDDLESSCRELRSKLANAESSCETLERRHFVVLQTRVREVEQKYERRCAELETLVASRQRRTVSDDGHTENDAELLRWKRKVHSRNREIERFRYELDAILRVLEELQSRGATSAWKVKTTAA